MIKDKKGQVEFSILTFIIVVIGLMIIAPFMLKIMNSILTPFGSAVGNMTETAGTNVNHIATTFVNFWDFVIMFAFLVNIILLFLTAFLVDTHPAWLIAYVIFGFILFIFAPEILDIVTQIYDSPQFALEVSQLAMLDWFRQYFGFILLGIYFISGVIVYSKFRWGGSPR